MAGWGSSINMAARMARALLRDSAGNALGITAATIFLLLALAGSGTDMARAYMTKTSLQNACDAGVLAGRKAMSKTAVYATSEKAKANKMFKFNFNPLMTGVPTPAFDTAATDTGSVTGTATANMPTVLMNLFGFNEIPMTVSCSAELQMASADVMFVLDTTGSMAYDVTNTTCCNASNSKIVGLRGAVRAFYTTVAGAVVDKANTRIRFGFVPYSSTVNIKELITTGAMPTSYLADTASFQTKLGNFNTAVNTYPANTPTTGSPTNETYSSKITSANCTNYGINKYPTSSTNPVVTSNSPPTTNTSTQYAWKSWTKTSGSGSSALGTCVRTKTITTTTYATVTRYKLTSWRYAKTGTSANIDVSAFKGFGSVSLATSVDTSASTPTTVPTQGLYNLRQLALLSGTSGVAGVSTSSYTWDGCIEERATVPQLSMSPVPSGAKDLDLDTAPVDDATRWKMYLEPLEWYRSSNTSYDQSAGSSTPNGFSVQTSYCPAPMKQFTEVDTTAPTVVPTWLNTYLNNLVAEGATYHDIGMIWGGRLGSPNGMFQDNVITDETKYPSVSRHVIFMSDGTMEPTTTIYNAYGTEYYDNRVGPSGATGGANGSLAPYHNARFLAVCEKLKQMGYTVWVIGFGQTLTTPMKTCSTADRAYYASNTTELTNTFKFIAGQVADLRINK